MKLCHVLVLSLLIISSLCFNTSPDTKYDWDEHSSGEDLKTTLTDEAGLIFIVFMSQQVEDDDVLSLANDALRTKIKNDLSSHNEVVYTEVDFTETDDETQQAIIDTYKTLATEDMGIDLELLKDGPIIAVMNRGEGSWIHGKGLPVTDDPLWYNGQDSFEEVLDSIEIFIEESKDLKQGGAGSVAGSGTAARGGAVSLGS